MSPVNSNEKAARLARVLVAEDDFLISQDITRILREQGYLVVGTAPTGKKALELTASEKPDVVLMDIKMPEMDGLEAAERIQRQSPTPVVVLTAHESQELTERAKKNGVGAFLTKPPTPGDIDRAIQIAMARHGDLMECRRYAVELKEEKEKLEKAMAELKVLRGIIPICMHCKKIRNDSGFWEQVETYISQRSDAEFSHSLCPDCARELYGAELDD
jgi:AmiR/NasT family two-component response regulator